jgi:hypothetical protein
MTATATLDMSLLEFKGFEELSSDEQLTIDGGNVWATIFQQAQQIWSQIQPYWTPTNMYVRSVYPTTGWAGVVQDARQLYNNYVAYNVPFLPYI